MTATSNGGTPLEVEVREGTVDLELKVGKHPRKPGDKPPVLAAV